MSDLMTAFLSFAVPLCVTLFVLPKLAHIASSLGLVDQPNRRKVHTTPRPLVGGLAMSLGVAFSCLLFLPLSSITGYEAGSMRGFYAGLIILVLIGFLDDFREVNHRLKFLVQIIASLLVVFFSHVSLTTFGDLLHMGSIDFPSLGIPMTVLGVVGVINALNMIDGVDGLAGGISLMVFASFAYLSFVDGHTTTMLLSLAVSGALIAFLRYNWHPSKLFMGDAGSLFLGFSAAFAAIVMTQDRGGMVKPVAPLLVLAVPITDTLTVMIKRMIRGKSPFHADKTHLHHVLLKYGFTKRQTASIIIAVTSVFCLFAIAGTLLDIPEYDLFLLFLIYFFSYFSASFFVKRILHNRRTKSSSVAA